MNRATPRVFVAIILFIVPVVGFLVSISLFIPGVREMIIGFGEIHIVHRALTHPAWHERMIEWAYAGLVFSLLLAVVVTVFMKDVCKIADCFFNKDLVYSIRRLWTDIPMLYTKSFCAVFFGLNIVFALHTAIFMIGNHDWELLFSRSPLVVGELAIGRYFYNIFSLVLMNGRFLPVLTNLVNFIFFALAAVMLCSYWRLPKSILIYSVTGLLFVLQPYIIARMYGMGGGYYMTLPFFVLAGFFLGDKAVKQDSRTRRLGFVLLAALSFWFALGTYAVVVSTIAVVFIGRFVIEYTSEEKPPRILKMAAAHIWTILAIVLALCFHVVVVAHLGKTGKLSTGSYMTETIGLRDIPSRLIEIVRVSFRYLFEYKVPFFPRSFTLLFTALFAVSLLAAGLKIFRSKIPAKTRFLNIAVFLILFYAALFFSFTSSLITNTDIFFWARVDFFGIAYFHILIVAVLFQSNINFHRNVSLLFCFILIYISAISDFYAMKVWKLGFDAEKMEWNRLIARIETTAGYQDDKDYRLIILGATRAYRPYFYDGKYHQEDLLDWPYMASWGSQPVRLFYAYTAHSRDGLWRQVVHSKEPEEFNEIIDKMTDELEGAEAWPSLQSIFIKDDVIFIALDRTELERVKQGLPPSTD
ncbi:MAG: glucosyltransferase domain-containing protein [Treponema sp.]|nr:glucosyltransferase domain-containing protein [Treponema sp.]